MFMPVLYLRKHQEYRRNISENPGAISMSGCLMCFEGVLVQCLLRGCCNKKGHLVGFYYHQVPLFV